jgi:hypothetical protein
MSRKAAPNKGLQLTKAARCAPFAFRLWGQSLRAAFAAEARCYPDRGKAGGAEYARESARELGILECFVMFLPKPQVVIDDQAPSEWRHLIHPYPTDAPSRSLSELERSHEQGAG